MTNTFQLICTYCGRCTDFIPTRIIDFRTLNCFDCKATLGFQFPSTEVVEE